MHSGFALGGAAPGRDSAQVIHRYPQPWPQLAPALRTGLSTRSVEKITRSRQHYIRFTLPHTYRSLLAHHIEQDFSMGYGSINGFRASVASSYNWYDLQKDEETRLRLMPFCFMDANSYYEQHNTAAQAMSELLHYYHHIRKVGGLMVTVWHNDFLGANPQKAGWREVYETFLKEEIYWD